MANLVFLWCLWHLAIEVNVANMENNDKSGPLCETKAQDSRWILMLFLSNQHLLLWAHWAATDPSWLLSQDQYNQDSVGYLRKMTTVFWHSPQLLN